jgi:hypothetical protein
LLVLVAYEHVIDDLAHLCARNLAATIHRGCCDEDNPPPIGVICTPKHDQLLAAAVTNELLSLANSSARADTHRRAALRHLVECISE